MKKRTRTIYTATQKALMWDRWQKGDAINTLISLRGAIGISGVRNYTYFKNYQTNTVQQK